MLTNFFRSYARLAAFALITALGIASDAQLVKPSTPAKAEWKGTFRSSRTVFLADLRDKPRTTMDALAVDLSRIVCGLPKGTGYTVEWVPSENNEGGSFRVTTWLLATQPPTRL